MSKRRRMLDLSKESDDDNGENMVGMLNAQNADNNDMDPNVASDSSGSEDLWRDDPDSNEEDEDIEIPSRSSVGHKSSSRRAPRVAKAKATKAVLASASRRAAGAAKAEAKRKGAARRQKKVYKSSLDEPEDEGVSSDSRDGSEMGPKRTRRRGTASRNSRTRGGKEVSNAKSVKRSGREKMSGSLSEMTRTSSQQDVEETLEGHALYRPSDRTLSTNYNHPYDWMHPGTPLRTQNASVQEAINSIDRELQSMSFLMEEVPCSKCGDVIDPEANHTHDLKGYCWPCYLEEFEKEPEMRPSKEEMLARRSELEKHALDYQIDYSQQPQLCYWCGSSILEFSAALAKRIERRSRIDINGEPMPSCANCGVRESAQFRPAMDRMGKLCVPCYTYKSIHGIERDLHPISPFRLEEFVGAVCESTDDSTINWSQVAADEGVNPGFAYSVEGIHTQWFNHFKSPDAPPYQTFMLLQRNHLAKRDEDWNMYFCTARHPAQAALYFARFTTLYRTKPATTLYIRQVEAWNIPATRGDEWEDASLGLISFDELRRRIRVLTLNKTKESTERQKHVENRKLQKQYFDGKHQEKRAQEVVDHVQSVVKDDAKAQIVDHLGRLSPDMNRLLYARWLVRKRYELGSQNQHLEQHLIWDKEEQARELYRFSQERMYFGHEELYLRMRHEIHHLLRRPYLLPNLEEVLEELYALMERQEFLADSPAWLKKRSRPQKRTMPPFRQQYDLWTPREQRDLPEWAKMRRRKIDMLTEADERVQAVIEKHDGVVNLDRTRRHIYWNTPNRGKDVITTVYGDPPPEPTYEALATKMHDEAAPMMNVTRTATEARWHRLGDEKLKLEDDTCELPLLRPWVVQDAYPRSLLVEEKQPQRLMYLNQIQEWDASLAAARPRTPVAISVAATSAMTYGDSYGDSSEDGNNHSGHGVTESNGRFSKPLCATRQPLPDPYDMTPTPPGDYPVHLLPAEYQVHVFRAVLQTKTRQVTVRMMGTERYKRQGDSIGGGGPVRVPPTINVENMRGFYRDMERTGQGVSGGEGGEQSSELLRDKVVVWRKNGHSTLHGVYEAAEVVLHAHKPPPLRRRRRGGSEGGDDVEEEDEEEMMWTQQARTGVQVQYKLHATRGNREFRDRIHPDPAPNPAAMSRVASRAAGRRGVGFMGWVPGTPGARPSVERNENDSENGDGGEEEEVDEEEVGNEDAEEEDAMSSNSKKSSKKAKRALDKAREKAAAMFRRKVAQFERRETVEELEPPSTEDAEAQVQFLRHMRALRRWQNKRVFEKESEQDMDDRRLLVRALQRESRVFGSDIEDGQDEDDDLLEDDRTVEDEEEEEDGWHEDESVEDEEEEGEEEEELLLNRRSGKRTMSPLSTSPTPSMSATKRVRR
ncbi:hypothetical protein BGZ73_007557 [Actinomortierella ambigua]|nr:hypothetical protein BGZ73_007557 [Actinomortierella ambigua]